MTVNRSAGPRTQGAIQETAQALVANGDPRAAAELIDRYLAKFDGDWGIWLYFGGLCARVGRRDDAVAAYRVCARQLEADGHFERARDALRSAMRLVPRDESLKREVSQIGRPLRRPDPAQETFLLLPSMVALPKPKPKLPDPKAHLTALIPGRGKRRKPVPVSPEITDPYCAIFDILDADRGQGRQ
jgi:hypothetical protein